MRRSVKRAFGLVVLAALSSSSALGWAAALHAVTGDHYRGGSSRHAGAIRLDLVLHGHAHEDGTPPHGHALMVSSAAPLPGKVFVLVGTMIGNVPEVAMAAASGRLPSPGHPTHDPPPRANAVSVLRV